MYILFKGPFFSHQLYQTYQNKIFPGLNPYLPKVATIKNIKILLNPIDTVYIIQ